MRWCYPGRKAGADRKSQVVQRFKDYFAQLGVTAVEVNERTLTVPIELAAGLLQGIVLLKPEQTVAIFYAASPMRVPVEQRTVAAEYITRVNYGLSVGTLEMDFDDGEIRCRVGLDYQGTPLSPTQIGNLIQPAVHHMDRYLPGLLAVLRGERTPQEAVHEAESTPA